MGSEISKANGKKELSQKRNSHIAKTLIKDNNFLGNKKQHKMSALFLPLN